MSPRVLAVALAFMAVGCRRAEVDLDNRPCARGRCGSGYTCDPFAGVCVRPELRDCAAGGLCPAAGDPCLHPGSFVPCAEDRRDCGAGCHLCGEDLTWSACISADCELGGVATCATCGDDCGSRVRHAAPVCRLDGPTFACGYDACDPGYGDADGRRGNGCECPVACDGRCDGPDGCGGTCPDVCRAPESCVGGGTIGVCGFWWSCAYARRQRIQVEAGASEVPAGYAVDVGFSHAARVAAGEARADGSDVRVVWWDGSAWQELQRVADPETNASGWNRATTRLWFAVPTRVSPGAALGDVYIYYGSPSPGPVLADEGKVFHFADFFDRPDNTDLDAGTSHAWIELQDDDDSVTPTDVAIAGNALCFPTTGVLNNRPYAGHTFPPLSGRMSWRFAARWRTTLETDETYHAFMQLGAGLTPPSQADPAFSTVGISASFDWGRHSYAQTLDNVYAAFDGTSSWPLWDTTGPRRQFEAVLDTDSQLFSAWIGGDLVGQLSFPDPAARSIDSVRFFTFSVTDDAAVTGRLIEYVLVRPLVASEPAVTLDPAVDTSPCP